MSGKLQAARLLVCALAALAGCGVAGRRYSPEPSRTARQAGPQDHAALDRAVEIAVNARYREAAREFARLEQIFRSVGDVKRVAEAMFWLAYCHERQGNSPAAIELYKRLLKEHSDTPAARQAGQRLKRLTAGPAQPGRPK